MRLTEQECQALVEWARLLEGGEFFQIRGPIRDREGTCAMGVSFFVPKQVRRCFRKSSILPVVQLEAARRNDLVGWTFHEIAAWLREIAAGGEFELDDLPPRRHRAPADRIGDEPLCGALV
jgi:hypothetical protein